MVNLVNTFECCLKGPYVQQINHFSVHIPDGIEFSCVVGLVYPCSDRDTSLEKSSDYLPSNKARGREKQPRKKITRKSPRPGVRASASEAKAEKEAEDRTQEALDLILETLEALAQERGSGEKIWGSMVKQTLKRRRPSFNESYYGFPSFNRLLEEAASRGLMDLESDEKSGGYIIRRFHQDN